jgi:hypothetical protein
MISTWALSLITNTKHRAFTLTTISKSGRKRIATMKAQELHLHKKKATGGTKKAPTEAEN